MATDHSTRAGPTSAQTRPPSAIRAELADLRRHLVETPPHHGAGVREVLTARIALLERELAAADE
ncbi:MAG: hypothetical protein R6V28_08845 [Nitriliruptoraceae bacterium]